MPRTPRLPALALALVLATGGCQSVRLYAKDLLDPEASAAVTIPVKTSMLLFVLPPCILWLPISALPLAIFHDEDAVWFALAPGIILGGPFVLLFGTPGYLLTDRPPHPGKEEPEGEPAPGDAAAVITSGG
jgi:hypothetical protein